MSIGLQLVIATVVIAALIAAKIIAFRVLVGQKPTCAVDTEGCEEKDCLGGCGGHD